MVVSLIILRFSYIEANLSCFAGQVYNFFLDKNWNVSWNQSANNNCRKRLRLQLIWFRVSSMLSKEFHLWCSSMNQNLQISSIYYTGRPSKLRTMVLKPFEYHNRSKTRFFMIAEIAIQYRGSKLKNCIEANCKFCL